MSNLEKFAAQRLTKPQMNNIKGGIRVSCDIEIDGELFDMGYQDTDMDCEEFTKQLQATYEGIGTVSCQPWLL